MTLAGDYFSVTELKGQGFASVGSNVFVSRAANIVHPRRIHLGDHVRIDPFSLLIAKEPIKIGCHVHIGSSVTINAVAEVRIGDFSGISSGTKIFTADDDYGGEYLTGPTVEPEFTNITVQAVILHDNCIVGANSVILPGAELEQGVAVGALSLVKGRLQAWTVYGGVPAAPLKPRSRELLEKAEAMMASRPRSDRS